MSHQHLAAVVYPKSVDVISALSPSQELTTTTHMQINAT